MQYPENIVSEGREAGLIYPFHAQHCRFNKTLHPECSAEQPYRHTKIMAIEPKKRKLITSFLFLETVGLSFICSSILLER